MEEIRALFKRTIIITIVCVILGVITRNTSLLFGISGGSIVSILSLYMLSLDVKAISYCRDTKTAKRIAYSGYAKRYFLHLLFLGALLYFTNDFRFFLSGFIGTLNVKLTIYTMNVLERIKKYLK